MSNTNIDNKEIINIDNNIDTNRKFSLKRSFKPRTAETQAAYDIASELDDLNNYARYLSIVNQIGPGQAIELFHVLHDVMKRKLINNPGAYYNRMACNFMCSKNGRPL